MCLENEHLLYSTNACWHVCNFFFVSGYLEKRSNLWWELCSDFKIYRSRCLRKTEFFYGIYQFWQNQKWNYSQNQSQFKKFFSCAVDRAFYLPEDDGNYNGTLKRIMFQLPNLIVDVKRLRTWKTFTSNHEGTSSHQGDARSKHFLSFSDEGIALTFPPIFGWRHAITPQGRFLL